MKTIINYTDDKGVNTQIEFDNIEDAYSFTFDHNCSQIEILGDGVYSIEDFQNAFSNNEL